MLAGSVLLEMVTSSPARMLRLPDAGRIAVGRPADLLVVPAAQESAAAALLRADRSRITLVTIGGRPLVGTRLMRKAFDARCVASVGAVVDGADRLLARHVARRLTRSRISEPGLQLADS
jgi:cytosine/adenosine deaminase-related metal-dependent hydrolase